MSKQYLSLEGYCAFMSLFKIYVNYDTYTHWNRCRTFYGLEPFHANFWHGGFGLTSNDYRRLVVKMRHMISCPSLNDYHTVHVHVHTCIHIHTRAYAGAAHVAVIRVRVGVRKIHVCFEGLKSIHVHVTYTYSSTSIHETKVQNLCVLIMASNQIIEA
jgi:hypothetical protein